MTIKQIAALCAVDRRTVERWAHKVTGNPGQNAQGISDILSRVNALMPKCGDGGGPEQSARTILEKMEQAEKSGRVPAEFTLEETLAIIGQGGGNGTLAALLAENAANKNALAVRAPDPAPAPESYTRNELNQIIRYEINRAMAVLAPGRLTGPSKEAVRAYRGISKATEHLRSLQRRRWPVQNEDFDEVISLLMDAKGSLADEWEER